MDPTQPRARLSIVYYVAACRGCPFNTRSLREANSHSLSERHTLAVSKHYLLEPE